MAHFDAYTMRAQAKGAWTAHRARLHKKHRESTGSADDAATAWGRVAKRALNMNEPKGTHTHRMAYVRIADG